MGGILSALGSALAGGISGAGQGVVEGVASDMKEEARAREIKEMQEAEQAKMIAIAHDKYNQDNAPANRFGEYLKNAASNVQPAAAPAAPQVSGAGPRDPGAVDLSGDWNSINASYKAGQGARNSTQSDILNQELAKATAPADVASLGREISRVGPVDPDVPQMNLKTPDAAAPQGASAEARTQSKTDVLRAAVQKAFDNGDALAAEYGKKLLEGQHVHVGPNGVIYDNLDNKIVYANDAGAKAQEARLKSNEDIADKKIAAASAMDDKRLAVKQEIAQAKVDASASAKTIDPRAVESAAQMYGTYAIKPPGDRFMQSAFGQAVVQKMKENYPDYSAIRYGEIDKSVKAFSTGKQGDAVRSFNTAIEHIGTANGLIDAMENKNVQAFNRLGNFFGVQFGSDEKTNFTAVKSIVADEIAKAVIGGQTAQGDRQELAHNLDEAKSPTQLRGVIFQWKALMRGQLDGLRAQYERTTGNDDFDDNFLSKASREVAHGSASLPGPTVSNPVAAPAGKNRPSLDSIFGGQ